MKWIIKYLPACTAMLILGVALYTLYPYYCFTLEADSVSYLTIARRYATGDIDKAINGYWSPWSSWLVSILIKGGLSPIPAAIIVNSIGALGFLGISQSLFLKFDIRRYLQWLLNYTLAFFLIYAVYRQWFADTWHAFFLLCVLRLLASERYMRNPILWVWAGLLGGLAYLSRSYAFPFFMAQIICCSFIVARELRPVNMSRWILSSFTALVSMTSFSALWIRQLYTKYRVWTFSTAAHLNLSWNVLGKKYWNDEYTHLVPPVYGSSPNWWEDPFLMCKVVSYKGQFISFLILRFKTVGLNMLNILGSMNDMSFFLVLSAFIALALLLSGKVRAHFHKRALVLACSFVLFPLGYLLRASQESYLWYMIPVSMLLSGLFLQQVLQAIDLRVLRYVIAAVFFASYLCHPVLKMKEMFYDGYADVKLAGKIKTAGVKGTFTSNASSESEKATVDRLAYYTELCYYQPINDPGYYQVLAEMRSRNIEYYLYFNRPMDNDRRGIKDEQGNNLQEINIGINTYPRIFQVNP